MDLYSILFYVLATTIVVSSALVVLVPNPIFSSLFLALTMVLLSGVFFLLKAYFIAGVQLIVYAGAVMVLFVMVIMLFDLKREKEAFSKGIFSNFLKLFVAGGIAGAFFGNVIMTSALNESGSIKKTLDMGNTTKDLAIMLFSKYLFAFEALGLLLLLIAIGAVAVSRAKGGTHVKPE